MADKKISALTAATTPLVGSEVLPIVQGGSTVKVSVDNLTAGKTVSALNMNLTGATIPTNGIYLPAANTVAISTNSTGKVWVDSTGNVGVGTATPAVPIDVSGPSIRVKSATGYSCVLLYSDDPTATTRNWAVSSTYLNYGDLCFAQSNAKGGDPLTAATVRFSINQGGNPVVNTGNLIIGTAGKGIDFSANTHAAGMTSELLNDYEEGTWTPGVSGDGGSAGSVAFTSAGYYTKVGRLVTLHGRVSFTNLGSWTGRVRITGVPFSANVAAGFGSANITLLTLANACGLNSAVGTVSFTEILFPWSPSNGGGGDNIRFTDLAATSVFNFTLSYIV